MNISETFKAALELRIAILEAHPLDEFAKAMRTHLGGVENEIEAFVKSLNELHDLIDIRRCLMGALQPNLTEWVESKIYEILHSRA